MAESNKIVGDVTVVDVKTEQTVRSFSLLGGSALHYALRKSYIDGAIERAAEEIIKGLTS